MENIPSKSYTIYMKLYVIVTSFNEPATIGKAVEQILCPNRDLWASLQLVIVAPDQSTLEVAEKVCQKYKFEDYRLITDPGSGKPVAFNIAVEAIRNDGVGRSLDDLIIFTDGDVYLRDDAIKNLLKNTVTGGVGGHPVSEDSRQNMFGYFSHLFCKAAHVSRLKNPQTVPMSGYLYTIKGALLSQIFPIPAQIRAEDAYISQKMLSLGYKIDYAPGALVYVKFPKNLGDWYKQKTRSLGGNVQLGLLRSLAPRNDGLNDASPTSRNITQDLRMILFPLLFAKSSKEFFWSLLLYPLRLFLWVKIYCNHALKRYKPGAWDRIESSK